MVPMGCGCKRSHPEYSRVWPACSRLFSCMLQYAQLFFIRARFPVRAPANKYTFFIKFQL